MRDRPLLFSLIAADDVVKVEVWDVVDKARRRKTTANQNSGGLKLNNNDKVEYEETDDELGTLIGYEIERRGCGTTWTVRETLNVPISVLTT